MKRLFFLFFAIPLISIAQQGFYIGTSANTGFYELYNYNDFHPADFYFPQYTIKPVAVDITKFYDFTLGAKFGYAFNERSMLDFGFSYNQYRQDYRQILNAFTAPINYYSKLHYGSFTTNYVLNLINRHSSEIKPCFYVMAGVHLSYLLNFYEYQNQYENDNMIYFNSTGINNNGSAHSYGSAIIYTAPPTTNSWNNNYTTESIYNKYIYGVNAGVGFKNHLTKNLDLGIDLNGIYDINNVDNLNATITNSKGTSQYWKYATKFPSASNVSDRQPSHNIYAGLGFSLICFLGGDGY